MGRQKPGKPRQSATSRVTREPNPVLTGWPRSHVAVELTGDEAEECVRVTIHGVEHLLHASTARELSNMLLAKLDAYNEGVRAVLENPALRAMLAEHLTEWTGPNGEVPSLKDLIV